MYNYVAEEQDCDDHEVGNMEDSKGEELDRNMWAKDPKEEQVNMLCTPNVFADESKHVFVVGKRASEFRGRRWNCCE